MENGISGSPLHKGSYLPSSINFIVGTSCLTNPPRMTLGILGSYVGILIRIVLSIVWYGSQAWLGGLCVSALLSSWSYSFLMMENTFPESAHMVTRDFIGFVLFHLISVPFMMSKFPSIYADFLSDNY